jgi:hypothetical protein
MAIPYVPGLTLDEWAGSSPASHLETLGNLEKALAFEEGRTWCPVHLMSEHPHLTEAERSNLLGNYDPSNNSIYISDDLVASNEPYQAVNTLFHESRHAYQYDVIENHPERALDEQQLQDWKMNFEGGYLNGEGMPYSAYRWQPVESDANNIAMQRSVELYPQTAQSLEEELADEKLLAQQELGADYELAAKDRMYNQHRLSQIENYESSQVGQSDQLNKTEPQASESNIGIDEVGKDLAAEAATYAAGPIAGEAVEQVTEAVTNSSNQSEGNAAQISENSARDAPAKAASASDEEYDYSQGYGY